MKKKIHIELTQEEAFNIVGSLIFTAQGDKKLKELADKITASYLEQLKDSSKE